MAPYNYRIELKSNQSLHFIGMEYEVWFTDESLLYWRVSQPVAFERAIELLQAVKHMYDMPEATLLPNEFHIVGRTETKYGALGGSQGRPQMGKFTSSTIDCGQTEAK